MSIYAKLFQIQHDERVSLYKNKAAHNYTYTTLIGFWDTVQPVLRELKLYLDWSVDFEDNRNIVIVRVVDIETGENKSSRYMLNPTHDTVVSRTYWDKLENAPVKDEKHLHDFKLPGAEISYWFRILSIRILGLVTRDDEEAENMNIPSTPSSSSGSSSSRVVY